MVRMSQVFASCLVGLRRSLASIQCQVCYHAEGFRACLIRSIGKLYRVNEYEKYKAGVDKQILSLKRELDKYTNKSGDNPYDR